MFFCSKSNPTLNKTLSYLTRYRCVSVGLAYLRQTENAPRLGHCVQSQKSVADVSPVPSICHFWLSVAQWLETVSDRL